MTAAAEPGAPPPRPPRRWRGAVAGRLGDLALGLLCCWLFADLAAPGLQPADAGEFQLVARDLGVAHPPGYPLYTMLAHAFGRAATQPSVVALFGAGDLAVADPWLGRVPLGPDRWPWAVNLFSTLLALAVLAALFAAARRLTGLRLAGVVAVACLAFTPTFQAQASIANIRMPTALLAALVLLAAVRVVTPSPAASPTADRDLVGLAFTLGLAAGHHPSLAFLGLPVALAVAWRRPAGLRRPRTLAAMLGAAVVALAPLAYLPLRDRAGAVLAPGNLDTLRGLAYHALALGFRGDALYFDDVATLVDRLRVLADIAVLQFGGFRLALAGLGLAALARRDGAAAVLVAGAAGIVAALAVAYRAPQTVEYLLPAYVALALAMAAGAAPALRWAAGRRGADAAVALAILAAIAAAPSARGVVAAARDATPALEPAIAAALGCAPPGGTVLASWHFASPLRYAARHTTPRPDVTVAYVSPAGSETPGATWLRRLREAEAAAPGRAVILTNRPREVVDAGVPLWPVPRAPFFATAPLDCGGAAVALVGAAVQPAAGGGRVRVEVAFQAVRPVTDALTVVVQLVDVRPPHAVVGQADHTLGAGRWNDPRGVVERLDVHAFEGMADRRASVAVGVYRTTPAGPERLGVTPRGAAGAADPAGTAGLEQAPAGEAAVRVGEVDLQAAPRRPPRAGIPFGDAMALAASSVARHGDQLVVDLEWQAGAAYRSDYTVSVQARGDGWSAQDDGTPALGAIPTLKWLPGMRIRDRHRVALPPGVPPDAPYRVTVGVYDAFSLEPLPVTDAERVRQGQGQAVEIHAGP